MSPLPDLTRVVGLCAGRVCWLDVPPPGAEVLPGVPWGRFDTFYTPAFWRAQVWFDELARAEGTEHAGHGADPSGTSARPAGPSGGNAPLVVSGATRPAPRGPYALGRTLDEEVAACLLGGYGIPAEVGVAAFARLAEAGLLDGAAAAAVGRGVWAARIARALASPLCVRGRLVRYRFARQKSAYVAGALCDLAGGEPPPGLPAREFRDWLLRLPGVGLKTASWITRNHLGSDDVAILDVHVVRAGRLVRLFTSAHRVERDYRGMEERFLALAQALGVSAAALDAVIWREMRGGGVTL